MKRYFVKNKKCWYESTLRKASVGLKPKPFPLSKKLLATEIYWILDNFFDFMFHLKKVEEADLKYPIILTPEGEVADGWHRIIKALKYGYKIKYVQLKEMPKPDKGVD